MVASYEVDIMRRTQAGPDSLGRRSRIHPGARQGQPAALTAFSYSRIGRAQQRATKARDRVTQESCVGTRRRAAASHVCMTDNNQILAQRTLQACRILTAATAAALALYAAPAYAGQPTRSGGTLSIDRAWMEELLMSEMDRRVTSMSDDELVAAFKEVLQAKLPSNAAASKPDLPPSPLQQLPAKMQGFRLHLPWQQAPPSEDSSNDGILSKLLQGVGAGTKEAAAGESTSPEAVSASQVEAGSSSPEATLASSTPEDAPPRRLGKSLKDPQSTASSRNKGAPSQSRSAGQSDQPRAQKRGSELATVQSEGRFDAAPAGNSKRPEPGRSRESEQLPLVEEAGDETGSLMDAVGLPLQLQEDNLPEIAPASQPDRPGASGVAGFLRSTAAAASGAAAALAEQLKVLRATSQGSVQPQPSKISGVVGQVALVTGTFGGLYLVIRGWLTTNNTKEPEPTPASQLQKYDLAEAEVPGVSGSRGILSSAAASIRLLPSLLGFPIALTAPEEVLPLPDALTGSEQAPRQAKLSYKGAMLDGLQASRSLYSAHLPNDAPSQQAMDPDQAPPDPGVLWQRSRPQPESAPAAAASALPASAGADGAVLWRRAEAGAPTSLTFPRGHEAQPGPPRGQDSGRPGQRHVSRASALLDNVAPAAAGLPPRLPARQHVDGSKAQPATASGDPGTVAEPSAELPVLEEDPWQTARSSLGPLNAVKGSDSPEHWVAMHRMIQDRGEDPWTNDQHGTVGKSIPDFSGSDFSGADSRKLKKSSDLSAPIGKQSAETNGNGSSARPDGSAGMRGLYDNVEMLRR